jgi:hypothetical protein
MSEVQKIQGQIANEAYRLWEAAGRPDGRALDHWLEAEAWVHTQGVHGTVATVEALRSGAAGPVHRRGVRYGLVLRKRQSAES